VFFGLPDDARELRDGVRSVLSTACPPAAVRAAWPGGNDTAVDTLWQTLAEVGVPALLVPEDADGLGLDELVAVAALQETGYAGVPGPVVETVTVAAPLLAQAGDPTGDLHALLSGQVRATVQRHDVVPYATSSALVVALDDEGARLLRCDDAKLEPVATVDGSRAAARVHGSGVALDLPAHAVTRAVQRATVGTAATLVGLGRRLLDLTVAYVSERRQFGAPVGSFQAVKHPLADVAVALEFAEPAVLRAAHSLATADSDAALHASMAKALASDAAWAASRACLQAHGAMGYTVEYDLHLFAKRVWALAHDWGSAAEHRERIADALTVPGEMVTREDAIR
jgi:alkylation response protein AidB-like acyl-CoA dehydrogenase